MNTPAERARYYQRCVSAADAAGVPVSLVSGHLREFVGHLHPEACAECGQPIPPACGKELCAACLLVRKRARDREYVRRKKVATLAAFFPVEAPLQCADCGRLVAKLYLHLVSLTPFCRTCGPEILAMREGKGAQWDR